jgi:hypothetical protein
VTAQPAQQPADDARDAVNADLTADQPAASGPSRAKTRRARRSRGEVENPDYAAFAARIIRAHGRRIADGDMDSLPGLLRLAAELEAATQHAVNGLRTFGYSWGEIAGRLGTTRQAAQQRWGRHV